MKGSIKKWIKTRETGEFSKINENLLKLDIEYKEDYIFQRVLYEFFSNEQLKNWNTDTLNFINNKFFQTENIETESFKITEISDISLEGYKRFKCNIYFKEDIKKFYVKKFVEEAIENIKILKNYGFSTNRVKHGDMEADAIHISAYKKDLRRGEKRSWRPENDNFICIAQYDTNKKFSIKNNLVDSKLSPERKGNIEYRWNSNFR